MWRCEFDSAVCRWGPVAGCCERDDTLMLPKRREISWLAEYIPASEDGHCSFELVYFLASICARF